MSANKQQICDFYNFILYNYRPVTFYIFNRYTNYILYSYDLTILYSTSLILRAIHISLNTENSTLPHNKYFLVIYNCGREKSSSLLEIIDFISRYHSVFIFHSFFVFLRFLQSNNTHSIFDKQIVLQSFLWKYQQSCSP